MRGITRTGRSPAVSETGRNASRPAPRHAMHRRLCWAMGCAHGLCAVCPAPFVGADQEMGTRYPFGSRQDVYILTYLHTYILTCFHAYMLLPLLPCWHTHHRPPRAGRARAEQRKSRARTPVPPASATAAAPTSAKPNSKNSTGKRKETTLHLAETLVAVCFQ